MPRGDGTGPAGAGSMTGRGMGFCVGYSAPGYVNSGFGRGMGRGLGRGFGRGFGYYGGYAYPAVQVNEKELLKNETAALESQLNAVKKRLSDIEKSENK